MKRIAELMVHAANLAEAEGRSLRGVVREEAASAQRGLARLGVAAFLLVGAVVLMLGGLGLAGVGVFRVIQGAWGATAASGLLGFALLALAAVALWRFYERLGR